MLRAALLVFTLTLPITYAAGKAATDQAAKGGGAKEGGPIGGGRRLTIFYSAEVHGTLEPCGCTSDPLGDVARYAEVVRAAAKSGAVLMVDAGGLSFPESSTPKEKDANRLRARFLTRALSGMGAPFVAGLAETDVGSDGTVAPRRLAVNLTAPAATAPSFLETLGGIRVGVFGVADPALAPKLGGTAYDPIAAAKREVEILRKAGAELVIALAPIERSAARRVAREAQPDFVVLGRQVGKGRPRAEAVGASYVVAPAEELQQVGRLDVVLAGAARPLADAGSPEQLAERRAELDKTLARLDADLKQWTTAGGGDPAFIAAKRDERDRLAAERNTLTATWQAPAGSYFSNRLVPLRRSVPRDPKLAAEMHKLDGQIAAVNLRNAPPPAPREPGRAYFVGDAKCTPCHKSAMAFWKHTVHASAWKTLVEGGKQNDFKCVSCHVTGYGEVGGTSLGHTDRLRDVQCEVCHGPGSTHVAGEGLEEPLAIKRATPASTCTTCHTEQHSDTFQYEAYLRDILGAGHGAAARAKLGDGPTGHALRSAALAKAKAAGKPAL
jgi:hypothetical protein